MKNNYRKRIVNFEGHNINTRMGENGRYPGDEYVLANGTRLLYLGCEESGVLPFYASISKEKVVGEYENLAYDFCGIFDSEPIKLIARHGQKLIDNGEMRQL